MTRTLLVALALMMAATPAAAFAEDGQTPKVRSDMELPAITPGPAAAAQLEFERQQIARVSRVTKVGVEPERHDTARMATVWFDSCAGRWLARLAQSADGAWTVSGFEPL